MPYRYNPFTRQLDYYEPPAPPGSGEANTGSNIGTGEGVFSTKSGVTLLFKSIDEGSNKVGITSDATTVFVDINEGNITHANLSGVGTNTHAQIDTHIADTTVHFTEGSINHTAITNIGTNSHAQIDTHIADADKHREINDSGTGATDLWSASKITTEISESIYTARIVFKEEFTGNGALTQFQLTSGVDNGTFSAGTWNASNVLTTLPSHVTKTNKKALYDSANLFTRNRISVSSINGSGLVTLSHAPQSENFYIWYWYDLQDADIIDDYYREDFIAEMESVNTLIAASINVDVTNFNYILSGSDSNIQTALETLDDHIHDHTELTSIGTNTHAQIDTHISNTSNPHSTTFIGLGDTPVGYTTANAIYTTNGTPNAVIETTVILTEGANTFNITKGTASLDVAAGAALDVDFNLSINGVSAINQDVQTTASPTFVALQSIDYIDFDVTASESAQEGRLTWNSTDGTLNLGMPGGAVNLQIGQEGLIRVRNISGSTINNGKLVYITGSTGALITIDLADNTDQDTIPVLGMATENINHNQNGYVALWGTVRGNATEPINTSSYVAGTKLYLDTSGNWTDTHPTVGNAVIVIGIVRDQHATDGEITLQFEYYSHGNNYDGTLRQSIINKSTGTSAATGFSSVNDQGYWMTVGIGGSNNTTFANNAIFYGSGYNDNLYAVDGNKSHKWYVDPTDSHNNSSLSYLSMELDPSGHLTLGRGQFTSTLSTGTSPLNVTSTTVNTNLNADLLDGQHGAYYLNTTSTLNDLADVDTSGAVQDQVIAYNASSGTWTPATIASSVDELSDLDDVNTVGVTDNQILSYHGSSGQWLPVDEDLYSPTRLEWKQNGFENTTDSTITFTDGSMTFSIQPTSTSFNYWVEGDKYTSTGDTKVIDDTEGIHIIYYDGTTLTTAVNPTDGEISSIIRTKCIVSIIYWDTSAAEAIYVGEERHGKVMTPNTHAYLHFIEGLRYVYGLGLNTINADGAGATADAQFGIDAGAVSDEDLYLTISAVVSTTGLPIYYMTGASADWNKHTESGFSARTFDGTNTTRLAYNQYTGGAWQLTEVSNNDFVLYHIFATTEKDYPMISVMGQNIYTNIVNARAGAQTEIESLILNNIVFPEIRPVGTVIFQTNLTYASAINARIRSTDEGDDYIDWRSETVSRAVVSTSDHGALTGLGDDDHTQYLLADGTRALAGAWDMGSYALTNVNIDTGDIATAVTNTEWDAAYIHVSSNGTDHSYIDQNVTTSGTPSFSTVTATTIYGTTFDTNITAAGVTLAGTTLAADGTDTHVDITITPKGNAGIVLPNASSAPAVTTNKLYQTSGILYFDGVSLEGGGASTLEGLTDTSISTPSQDDILFYNSSSGKWVNAAINVILDLSDLSDVDTSGVADNHILTYHGSSGTWLSSATLTMAGDINMNSNDIDNAKTITFIAQIDNGNSGASDTIDFTAGQKHKSTLTGNCTYTFTAPAGPCNLVLVLVQDVTGSRNPTWPASVKWVGGTEPTWSTDGGSVDIVSFYYDGTYYYGVASLDFS